MAPLLWLKPTALSAQLYNPRRRTSPKEAPSATRHQPAKARASPSPLASSDASGHGECTLQAARDGGHRERRPSSSDDPTDPGPGFSLGQGPHREVSLTMIRIRSVSPETMRSPELDLATRRVRSRRSPPPKPIHTTHSRNRPRLAESGPTLAEIVPILAVMAQNWSSPSKCRPESGPNPAEIAQGWPNLAKQRRKSGQMRLASPQVGGTWATLSGIRTRFRRSSGLK